MLKSSSILLKTHLNLSLFRQQSLAKELISQNSELAHPDIRSFYR